MGNKQGKNKPETKSGEQEEAQGFVEILIIFESPDKQERTEEIQTSPNTTIKKLKKDILAPVFNLEWKTMKLYRDQGPTELVNGLKLKQVEENLSGKKFRLKLQ